MSKKEKLIDETIEKVNSMRNRLNLNIALCIGFTALALMIITATIIYMQSEYGRYDTSICIEYGVFEEYRVIDEQIELDEYCMMINPCRDDNNVEYEMCGEMYYNCMDTYIPFLVEYNETRCVKEVKARILE